MHRVVYVEVSGGCSDPISSNGVLQRQRFVIVDQDRGGLIFLTPHRDPDFIASFVVFQMNGSTGELPGNFDGLDYLEGIFVDDKNAPLQFGIGV